ncbi:MAG: hypothetical protein E7478_02410 [Ruminococcaceae bacterium]|nr:hypothetical protein [Oscillospiraceae bacterium]
MAMNERSALSRTLSISRALYTAISKGDELHNCRAMLDSLSAALSHCNHAKKPLAKCMGNLKRELRSENKQFFLTVKPYFSIFRPTPELGLDKAAKHVPALIYGNDKICAELERGDLGKVKAMADAMKSYPGYLFGEFEALSGEQFYDLVFGFYPKLYEEPFMDEMRKLFCEE